MIYLDNAATTLTKPDCVKKAVLRAMDTFGNASRGAKIGPGELSKVLSRMPVFGDPKLLVGFDASDDAAACVLANVST